MKDMIERERERERRVFGCVCWGGGGAGWACAWLERRRSSKRQDEEGQDAMAMAWPGLAGYCMILLPIFLMFFLLYSRNIFVVS